MSTADLSFSTAFVICQGSLEPPKLFRALLMQISSETLSALVIVERFFRISCPQQMSSSSAFVICQDSLEPQKLFRALLMQISSETLPALVIVERFFRISCPQQISLFRRPLSSAKVLSNRQSSFELFLCRFLRKRYLLLL